MNRVTDSGAKQGKRRMARQGREQQPIGRAHHTLERSPATSSCTHAHTMSVAATEVVMVAQVVKGVGVVVSMVAMMVAAMVEELQVAAATTVKRRASAFSKSVSSYCNVYVCLHT